MNEQVPCNIRVLEVGCCTGQLSNFLAVAHRIVFGTDVCLNSLRLGHEFKEKNGLKRVGFYQMNLFRPVFKNESFPLVICNGVLHHTSNPFLGFQSISRLAKKGDILLSIFIIGMVELLLTFTVSFLIFSMIVLNPGSPIKEQKYW